MSVTSTIECPYCTSRLVITSHDDGHLETWHVQPFGPDCEARLQRDLATEARRAGMRPMFRN
jgi:hypothetical protein